MDQGSRNRSTMIKKRTCAGPLDGIRILDLSSVVMGPYATQILGDLGADIIKVEPPAGDNMRAVGPMRNPGMGAIYLHQIGKRRVGKECVSTGRSRWPPDHEKKKKHTTLVILQK